MSYVDGDGNLHEGADEPAKLPTLDEELKRQLTLNQAQLSELKTHNKDVSRRADLLDRWKKRLYLLIGWVILCWALTFLPGVRPSFAYVFQLSLPVFAALLFASILWCAQKASELAHLADELTQLEEAQEEAIFIAKDLLATQGAS